MENQSPDPVATAEVLAKWPTVVDAVLATADPYDVDHLNKVSSPQHAADVLAKWDEIASNPLSATDCEFDKAFDSAFAISVALNALTAYL